MFKVVQIMLSYRNDQLRLTDDASYFGSVDLVVGQPKGSTYLRTNISDVFRTLCTMSV